MLSEFLDLLEEILPDDLKEDPFLTEDIARLCKSKTFRFLCHMCEHARRREEELAKLTDDDLW